jgi:hypothetical protein
MMRRRARRAAGRIGQVVGLGRRPASASVRVGSPIAPDLVGGPRVRHDPARDAQPSLVVLMPHLSVARMTGGPNTVFHITERLALRGMSVRYVACFGPLDDDVAPLGRHIEDVTGVTRTEAPDFLDRSGADAELAIGRHDVMFATWWPTAHVADRARAVSGQDFIYLIQDFEPGFHPWSTKYALAASTYRMPFRAIVNEPTLLEHLHRHGELAFDIHDPDRAVAFMPAVDRSVFQRRDRPPGARRFVFYARPKHARNLFDLGLQALSDAAERGAFEGTAWEFAAIGGETRTLPLPGGHVLRPVPRLAYRDYATFLAESDVLLSLMLSPHTSYPPLEMATAGGLVITNTFSTKTEDALAAISASIRGTPPDVDHLSAAIVQAVADVSAGRPEPARTALPGSWDESMAQVVPWLEATIASARGRSPS